MKSQSYILFIVSSVMMMLMSSCQDDPLYNLSYIGEGESTISFNMRFQPIKPALDDTRASGTSIKRIGNVTVFVYDKNDNLYGMFSSAENKLQQFYVHENQNINDDGTGKLPGDLSDKTTTEGGTDIATFKLDKIPFGEYYFYVVANVDINEYIEKGFNVETPDDLKKIIIDWDESDIAANNAMFGYFMGGNSDPVQSTGFEAPKVTVNKNELSLSSWVRRLASKVTVVFDPSDLNESVFIYIKSVTIHDIPKACYLGKNNTILNSDSLIRDGETIPYYPEGGENDHSTWLRLSKGGGTKGSHKDEDNAMFFFENMQGNYSESPNKRDYYKPQIQGETGKSINEEDYNKDNSLDYKDRKLYGTYIEVEAFYNSQNSERVSSGPIKYRFMLGQDIYYNYNAIRNHHYKVTLKFNGWANEPDWHIVYDEPTPTIFLPEQYYVSYLYNQQMELPVRILGLDQKARAEYYLHAEITENNWIPYDPDAKEGNMPPTEVGALNEINDFAWYKAAYESTYLGQEYVGFLSLRYNHDAIVGNSVTYSENANQQLKNYYEGKEADFGSQILHVNPRDETYYSLHEQGDNISIMSKPGEQTEEDGFYSVKYIDVTEADLEKHETIVTIPLYTRPKELVSASDFTGNNPFESYQRKAVVKFTLRHKDTDVQMPFKVQDSEGKITEVTEKVIPIYQVRRIVNPKGIWRRYDNAEPFEVELMHLNDGDEKTFKAFESEGKWRVSILKDDDGLILISPINGKMVDGNIEGETGTTIKFKYQPNGTIGQNDARCGIILVEYHDYTCKHLIFVRQGYDKGMKLGNDSYYENGEFYAKAATWSCYNVVAAQGDGYNVQPQWRTTPTNIYVTSNPLSIGSFFKRCQYNYAILEENNTEFGWLVAPGQLKTAYIDSSNQLQRRTASWGSFGGFSWNNENGSGFNRADREWTTEWNALNMKEGIENKFTIPTLENFRALRDGCDYGYGVVYADGATKTADNLSDAYGFTSDDMDDKGESTKGMRACIVYNPENGNQILFPLGSTGQGRRPRRINLSQVFPGATPGSLSYSGMNGLLRGGDNVYRPLTYNLYRMPGAIYWFKKPGEKDYSPSGEDRHIASWDINYSTLVFNPYSIASLANQYNPYNQGDSSDALPIKLVYR